MSPDDQDLEKLARRRVEARYGLAIHAAIYVLVNIGLVLIWWFSGAHYPWFLWPLVGWGVGILAHALTFWFGPDSPLEENAVKREIDRLRTRSQHP